MTGKQGVVYLLKDRLHVYSPYLSGIVEFRFVPEIIRDLDVVNKNLLESLIKVFVTNGKIAPSNLIFVLADNTYFFKDFVMPTATAAGKTPQAQPQLNVNMESLKESAEKYIEHVPYDNVVSRTFPLKNGLRVCAANRDFYEAIKDAFEKVGFHVDSVIPGLVLGNNLSAKPVMDGALAMAAMQHANTVKEYDLLTQQTYVPSEKANENTDEGDAIEPVNKKTNKKRLIAMVGILASLIVLLVIVYVQSQTPPNPPQQPAQAQTPVSAVKNASTVNAVIPTATPIPPSTSVSALAKNYSVQIVTASASASVAQLIKTDLAKDSFKAVTIQSQSTLNSSTTLVTFSQSVDQSVRNAVLESVKKYKPDFSVQERQNSISDVSILLAN